jgi:MFS family permease
VSARNPEEAHALERLFFGWTFLRAMCHRGWWLCTSLYLVVAAELTPAQLLVYGATLGLVTLVAEIPTGVVADAVSRKRSLVISHLVKGAGMVLMGVTTDFTLILVSQLLWGLGWTFASGADVAWFTDELDDAGRTPRALLARARWEQAGTGAGILTFGALAWATVLEGAIVLAGLGVLALAVLVSVRFPERRFTPQRGRYARESLSIFRRGLALAKADREILVVLAATVLVNAATEVVFLYPKALVELGLPEEPPPIAWLTGLALVALCLAILALRIVERRIEGARAAPRAYALASVLGALGLLLLGLAPGYEWGMAGFLLLEGIAAPITRNVGVIWVNRRVTSDVRATVHSFLGQAESVGESASGLALALLAAVASLPAVFTAAAALLLGAALLVGLSRSDVGERSAANV